MATRTPEQIKADIYANFKAMCKIISASDRQNLISQRGALLSELAAAEAAQVVQA